MTEGPTAELTWEWVPLDAVEQHPDNAREGDVGAISTSLQRWGWYAPLVVQRSTGRIAVGNHRHEAARQLGMVSVPVHYRDLSDHETLALLAADNRMSDLARYDEEGLAALLRELAQNDMLEGTGYDGDDVDAMLARIEGVPPQEVSFTTNPEKLAVIVEVDSEERQRELIGLLTSKGYDPRAAVV